MQEKATEDTIIAAELSNLIREEGYEFALKSVDCVASENTEVMDALSFLNNQVQHTVGMRQTFKTQITDVRFLGCLFQRATSEMLCCARLQLILGKRCLSLPGCEQHAGGKPVDSHQMQDLVTPSIE